MFSKVLVSLTAVGILAAQSALACLPPQGESVYNFKLAIGKGQTMPVTLISTHNRTGSTGNSIRVDLGQPVNSLQMILKDRDSEQVLATASGNTPQMAKMEGQLLTSGRILEVNFGYSGKAYTVSYDTGMTVRSAGHCGDPTISAKGR